MGRSGKSWEVHAILLGGQPSEIRALFPAGEIRSAPEGGTRWEMPFGEYQYSLDDKGRVVIPGPFRDFLEDGLVLTRGMEGCLYIFPTDRWRKIEEQLVNLPLTDAQARAFVHFFYSGAHKTRMDNASRVLIPPPLRQFAGLKEGGEVVIAGAPGRLEIWSQERWWKAIEEIMKNPPAPEALRGLIG